MKADLLADGRLVLTDASEIRIVQPEHCAFRTIMDLFAERAAIALSATHAPAGYTHSHPLQIGGEDFYGGQFIPPKVVASATPEEKAKLNQPGPAADEPEHKNLPGYGGHPWAKGTPRHDVTYSIPLEHIHVDPERFQYKKNAHEKTGVTKDLSEEGYDPERAGELAVWKDPKDGKTYLVDGHHRREIAEQHGVARHDARYIDAKTAEEARAIGARMNGHVEPEPTEKPKEAPVPIPQAAGAIKKQIAESVPEPNGLPQGWEIKPHGDALGLYREGRDTPVAKAETHEELASKIHGVKKAAPVDLANAPKSKGHVAFVGKQEFYKGNDGRLYKASIGGKIVAKTGNRNGNLSTDAEMTKEKAKATPKPASAGPTAAEKPHTAPPVDNTAAASKLDALPDGATIKAGTHKLIAETIDGERFWKKQTAGGKYKGHISSADATAEIGFDTVEKEFAAAVPKEAKPKEPNFTGSTLGDDGWTYYFVDGVRVPGPQKTFASKPSTLAEEEPTSTVKNDDELAGKGKGSGRSELPAGEQLGVDAAATPQPLLPGSGEGVGGRPGSVPAGDDVRSDADVRAPGGSGDADGRGGRIGAGSTVAATAGRAGTNDASGDGGQRGGPGGSSPASPVAKSLNQPATPANPTDLAAGNFHYGDLNFAGVGLKTKYKQNLEALRTLRAIEAEGRTTATPAEQEVMSKYVGWGAFPGIFKEYGDADYDRASQVEWQDEAKALQNILSLDEWRAARGSILNAHYTHPDIVKMQWDIAKRLGFKGGRFLETSAGIGYYLGMMPAGLSSRTHSSAVEKDIVSGKMLALLYPSAHVNIKGFEEYKSPPNFFDLVASNVPFGNYTLHDKDYNKFKPLIHDYFFLKSADIVRPGGLVMHITSAGTMDKDDSSIRAELAKKFELVSAFRMPDATHKENAGTEVVTDMLILRKKVPGEEPVDPKVTPKEAQPEKPGFTGTTVDSLGRLYYWKDGKRVPGPKWLDTVEVPCVRSTSNPNGGEPILINQYFADHPEQILGELNRTGKLYGGDQKNVSLTADYAERLAGVIDRLPHDIMTQAPPSKAFEPESEPAPGDVRPGGYTVKKGKLYKSEDGRLVLQDSTAKNLERIEGMMAVRDATRQVIADQRGTGDATASRAKLNEVYDAFVAEHGFLNLPANKRAFRGDPDAPVLLALEKWNNEGKTAAKSDMFFKDTIRRDVAISHADSASDALAATLQAYGHIDLDHMSKLLDKDIETVKGSLIAEGLAYDDPAAGFQPADQYLSGNVRRKLTLAQAAAAADPKYQVNVDALLKVQPEDVDYTDITARLGASWIPGKDIAEFAAHLLSGMPDDFDIEYVAATGEWMAHYTNKGAARIKGSEAANSIWGVEMAGRQVAGFMDLLKSALSGRSITIKRTEGSGDDEREVVDQDATDACRAKVQDLKNAFSGEQGDGWLWEDDERRARLHRFYNDNFNNIRNMQYNGSHLTFPGMNPAIKLHPHIPNFVWQVVTTGKGLAAHEVGTGKTYAMIASAMELRRLGLAKKPMIACLKANIEAITSDVLKLYPGAKILSTADMFTADKRKQTISQIATGNYDIVLMTHDNLNMLPMTPETNAKYLQEELEDLEESLRVATKDEQAASTGRGRSGSKKSYSVKALEKAKLNLEAKLKTAMATERKDDAVYFEDLGIGQIFIDEAHLYKTLPVFTKMDRVRGVPNGRSQRATNMLMRTRWLQERNGGRGVVFATGTPVSNTMAELYTMQRYLQPEALKERGIDKFDAWAKLFGDTQTKIETSVTGENKPVTRFAKFVNIPELMQIARQVIDVRRADDIKMRLEDVPQEARPKEANFNGRTKDEHGREYDWINGQTNAIVRPRKHDHVIAAPHSGAITALMKSLVDRAKNIPKGPPKKGDDNMLVICTDGRKGALDMRLVNPKAKDDPESKTNLAVANILKIAKERPGQVQLIFSDVGVNPMKIKGAEVGGDEDDEDLDAEPTDAEEDATGMRWYGDVIDKLVKGGIPREKIADFSKLKGAAKEDAQAGLRRGDILIGIGSTGKMGTGVNVQDKITAMHHLDVPWVPASIEQRVGRGWRFGNQNKDVDVFSYVTEGSLDQMFWQVVGTKADFINQIMTPGSANMPRTVQNADTETLSPSQLAAVASGDPRWLEKANLDEDIKNLRRAHVRHDKEQAKFKKAETATLGRIASFKQEASGKAADAKHLAEHPDFRFAIGDTAHTERKEADLALAAARAESDKNHRPSYQEEPLGTYRGMEVFIKGPKGGDKVYLRTPAGNVYETSGSLQGIDAIAQRIQNKYHLEAAKDVAQAESDLVNIRANLGKPFTKGDELQKKIDRVKAIEESLMPDKTKEKPPTAGESTSLSAVSPDVRAEAIAALRAMFPLSQYTDGE